MNAKKFLLTILVVVLLASYALGAYAFTLSHASTLKAAPSMSVPAPAPLASLKMAPTTYSSLVSLKAAPTL